MTDSPFHTGEQEIQARLGVREQMEAFAKRVVRDHLPNEHRRPEGRVGSTRRRARLNGATRSHSTSRSQGRLRRQTMSDSGFTDSGPTASQAAAT